MRCPKHKRVCRAERVTAVLISVQSLSVGLIHTQTRTHFINCSTIQACGRVCVCWRERSRGKGKQMVLIQLFHWKGRTGCVCVCVFSSVHPQKEKTGAENERVKQKAQSGHMKSNSTSSNNSYSRIINVNSTSGWM